MEGKKADIEEKRREERCIEERVSEVMRRGEERIKE